MVVGSAMCIESVMILLEFGRFRLISSDPDWSRPNRWRPTEMTAVFYNDNFKGLYTYLAQLCPTGEASLAGIIFVHLASL